MQHLISCRGLVPCAAVLIASSLVAGCDTGMTKPPGFEMQVTDPYIESLQAKAPKTVTVTNGAGQQVYSGPFEDLEVAGETANLDGKLNITWVAADGTSGQQTVTHDPASDVMVKWNLRDERFWKTETPRYRSPEESGFFIGFTGGIGERKIGAIGMFTNVDDDEQALVGVDELRGYSTEANVGYSYGPGEFGAAYDNLEVSLDYSYSWFDGDKSVLADPGGDSTAITFPFDIGGSTGINLADTGVNSNFEVDLNEHRFDLSAKTYGFGTTGSPAKFDLTFGGWGSYRELETKGSLQNLTFSEITSEDRTDVDEWRFGLKLGGDFRYEVRPQFQPYIGGSIGGYYRDAEMDGVQQTWAPGFIPANQQVPIEYDDDEDGFGYVLQARLGTLIEVTPEIDAHLEGYYVYDSEALTIDRRDNPSEGPNRIGTEDADEYGIQMGVRLNF